MVRASPVGEGRAGVDPRRADREGGEQRVDRLRAACLDRTGGEVVAPSGDDPVDHRAQGVELGVVRREADPDDARRTRVALTDAGSALVRGFRGDRREAIDRALSTFTDAERADLARLLTKLAEGWPLG